MSLTTSVRSELAAVALPAGVEGRAELSGMLRFSGVLRRHGGGQQPWTWLSTLRSTAARRADRQLVQLFDERCELRARRQTAPRPMLLVEIELPERLLAPLGLDVAADQRPGLPEWLEGPAVGWAYVRGVALAGLRLSRADHPHCELEAPTAHLSAELTSLLDRLGVRAAVSPHSRERWRVVIKSRAAIGTLLAGTGATTAYLRWEEEQTRRAVRRVATRGANADRANAQRSVRAATAQVATAVEALARLDKELLDDELRATALARLANPTASVGELAQVLDVSKATVSRRFGRLRAAVDDGPVAAGRRE